MDLHLAINRYHHPFSDVFFRYFTHVGDGIFAILVLVVVLFRNVRQALILLMAYILSSGIAQGLKRLIFDEEKRPGFFLSDLDHFHQVEGVVLHHNNSFPSGHATSAFALFCVLALLTQNKLMQILLFTCAALASFSRVYISQHFMADVYTGMIIGTLSAVLSYFITLRFFSERYEKPLHELIKK